MRHAKAGGTALDFWGALLRLTPEGENHARTAAKQLAMQLKGMPVVFTSNMTRHIQTAEIICEVLKTKPIIDWRLGPLDPEAWDEMMMKLVRSGKKFPDSWLKYTKEHEPALVEREKKHFLSQIKRIEHENHDREIVVISSSGLIEPVAGLDHELDYCEAAGLQ